MLVSYSLVPIVASYTSCLRLFWWSSPAVCFGCLSWYFVAVCLWVTDSLFFLPLIIWKRYNKLLIILKQPIKISHNKCWTIFYLKLAAAGLLGALSLAAWWWCRFLRSSSVVQPSWRSHDLKARGRSGKRGGTQIITLYIYLPCVNVALLDLLTSYTRRHD